MSAPHKYCDDPDSCTYSDCPTAFCDKGKHSLAAMPGSANSWKSIEGYEPMEECVTATGQEVGWVRPCGIGKHRPQPWGAAADWPGEWEAIPRGEWELSKVCVSYEAAKAHVEKSWPNEKVSV